MTASAEVRLDGGDDTLVVLTSPKGAPRLGYWGPRLPADADLSALARLRRIPRLPGMLDGGEALTFAPQAGEGFTGHPALIGHRDGRALVVQLTLGELSARDDSLRLTLEDERAEISLRLDLRLDLRNILSVRSRLTNRGSAPLTVDWLAAGALEAPHNQVMTFGGRWAGEFTPERRPLGSGLIVQENRTGRTSHHAPPFLVVGEPDFGESQGEVFALHLAWSGDHRMLVERLRDGRIQVQAGELFGPGEVILAPGESYSTPWLHIARSNQGLNEISERFHIFVREVIMGAGLRGRPCLVHFNTWEAIYFDHDEARLRELADLAASVGVERFVLDDGWFRNRIDDRRGLGDWTPDPIKYPDGLGPLIAHVRNLGMSFGLWVEPEMANADSDLLRSHPDWIIGEPGRDQPLGRGQYVLDLSRPEVAENIFQQLDALLRDNAIDYLKWDMNRDLTHPVSGGRWTVHRQTLAVYRLIDRVRAAHPRIQIESCASGGGRADYGILRRTDRVWTSDTNDPVERARIQRAFSIFFPLEVMGAHVGPRRSHTTARETSLRMRILTALTGHFGVEADLFALDEAERRLLSDGIALFKSERHWMQEANIVRLEHPDPGCLAQALAAYPEFLIHNPYVLVTVAQVETARTALLAPLRMAGLVDEATYLVTPLLVSGEPFRASGSFLRWVGIPLPLLHAGQGCGFFLEREGGL